MNKTHHNIIANYVGRIWGFISVFLFVPFYLKYLGSEAYGIISFYTVILGLLAFADAGLTATLNREFARTDRDRLYKANLLTTIETIYSFICVAIVLVLWVLAPIVATKWLNVEGITIVNAIKYIRIIGVGVAFQFICSLYQGGLMGLQKQVLANSMQVVWSFFRSGILLLPLFFFPTLEVYFGWQIGVTILYFVIIRTTLKSQLGVKERTLFSKQILIDVWKYAAGMMIMAILSALLIQTDKLVTSKLLSLSAFGYYSLASILSQTPLMLVTPIGIAILPKLTELISSGKQNEMLLLFRKATLIIASIASLVSFTLIAYMPDIIFLWTQNIELTNTVSQVARILCLGSLFQALQLMPYYLGLANGHTKTNVLLGVFSVVFLVPTIIFLVNEYGVIGAGIPWLIMSVTTFFLLGFLIIKKFTLSYFRQWLLIDTLIPFSVLLIFLVISYLITYWLTKGWFILGYCFIIGSVGLIIITHLFNKEFPDEKLFFRIKKFIGLKTNS